MTPSYLTVRKYGSTSTVAHSPLKVSLHVSAKPQLKVVEYRTQWAPAAPISVLVVSSPTLSRA